MAVKISGILITVSFVYALFSGNMQALSEAAVSGCSAAVTLTLSLLGMMCLWSGVLRGATLLGITDRLARLLAPLLKFAFPDAWRKQKGITEIAAALTANLLGIGNAATPLAIDAMRALSEGEPEGIATDDMVTFTVLGTASPSLIPTTVMTLRAAAGSRNPLDILPAVWLCSLCLAAFAIPVTRALAPLSRRVTRGSSPSAQSDPPVTSRN